MGEPLGAREPLIAGWALPCGAGLLCAPRWAGLLCAPCWAGLLGAPVGGGPPAHRPRREPKGSARRLEARPGPATAHGRRSQALRSLRRPPHRRRLCRLDWPGRHPPAPRPGPPVSPAPSTPVALVSFGLARPPPPSAAPWPCRPRCQSPFTPSCRTLIVESAINFACNSLTALSNHEFRLLELQRFQTLLKLLPIELHATFLGPGPAETFRLRGQALRLEVCLVPPVSAAPGVLRGVA